MTPEDRNEELLKRIVERIKSARPVPYATYDYFLWPFKGLDPLNTEEIGALAGALARLVPADAEVLVSFQTDGEIVALPVAMLLGKPLVICRDHHYKRTNLISFVQETPYWTRTLYCSSPDKWPGSRVCIVDAILSTGATVLAAIKAIEEKSDKRVQAVIVAVEKPQYSGRKRLQEMRAEISVAAVWRVMLEEKTKKVVVSKTEDW